MNENFAISKKTIDAYLEDNLDKYLVSLINEFKDPQYPYSNIDSDYESIRILLNDIYGILHTDSVPQIVDRLNYLEEETLTNILSDLDLNLNDTGNFNMESDAKIIIIISYVIRLIVSRLLLQVNILISTIQETAGIYKYDVFLSHCSWDAKEILGLKLILENEYNIRTYVDWIDDKQANYPRALTKIITVIIEVLGKKLLDLDKIISEKLSRLGIKTQNNEHQISNLIIKKLSLSDSLFYVQSRHYDHSRWMPWELGIAEAQRKKIFRIPIRYIRNRQIFGKYSGFLIRYNSIIDELEGFKPIT